MSCSQGGEERHGIAARGEEGAATLLMPIAARRQLFELPDELATKVSIEFYADPKDAFLKGLVE